MSALIRLATEADIPMISRVHVDSWRETYRGIMPDAHLASLRYEDREKMWRHIWAPSGGMHMFVADDSECGVVGFSCCGPEREADPEYKGEIYAIYLLKEHHRKGIGRRLFETNVADLMARDMPSLLLWVLADNPTCGFYEAMGGRRVHHKDIQIESTNLEEVAYGWPAIRSVE